MRIDRADSESELLGAPSSSAEIVKVVAGDFEVRLAESAAEIDAAQALRYRVFYEEMTAHPTPEMAARRRDFDAFDDVCDHLLVLDRRIRRAADDRLSGRGPGSWSLVHRQGRAQHRDHADAVARHRALLVPLQ